MHGIDQAITTYLAAIAIEGKSPRTIDSYAESIEVFRKIGRGLGFPDEVEAYTVDHVYAFLQVIRDRGASPAYQHRRHREVQTLFSWCMRMGFVAEEGWFI